MITRLLLPAYLGLMFVSCSSSLQADEPVDYVKQIKSVLRERGFACHGALQQEAGLRLDTAVLAIKGGDSGAAIKPCDVETSLLLKRVTATAESERMPPEGEPLKANQIAALRSWIAQKAEAPADEQPERHPRDHWAFQTPVRPAVPDVKSQVSDVKFQIRNPIDAFIAREHHQRGAVMSHRLALRVERSSAVRLGESSGVRGVR